MNEKLKYSIEGMKRGIRAARKNIKIFEEAIEKEKQTIADLKVMLAEVERKDALSKVMTVTVPEGEHNDNTDGRIN